MIQKSIIRLKYSFVPSSMTSLKTRRQEFNKRVNNSQAQIKDHLITCDYLILVGIFFHFWGYIDLFIEEQKGNKVEEKLNKLPQLRERLFKNIDGLENNIWTLRNILAHNPMTIHHGVNIGAIEFETGWTNTVIKPQIVKPLKKILINEPYFPTFKEKNLLISVSEIIQIIIDLEIDAEIEYSFLTLKKSNINLAALSNKYIGENSNQGSFFTKLYSTGVPNPKRTNVIIPSNIQNRITWAKNQNKSRIIKISKQEDCRIIILGYAPQIINGKEYKRKVTLINNDEFQALKDLATINREDWI